jgi:hypothetical protein
MLMIHTITLFGSEMMFEFWFVVAMVGIVVVGMGAWLLLVKFDGALTDEDLGTEEGDDPDVDIAHGLSMPPLEGGEKGPKPK